MTENIVYKSAGKITLITFLGQKATFLQMISNTYCICWIYCSNAYKITCKDHINGMKKISSVISEKNKSVQSDRYEILRLLNFGWSYLKRYVRVVHSPFATILFCWYLKDYSIWNILYLVCIIFFRYFMSENQSMDLAVPPSLVSGNRRVYMYMKTIWRSSL